MTIARTIASAAGNTSKIQHLNGPNSTLGYSIQLKEKIVTSPCIQLHCLFPIQRRTQPKMNARRIRMMAKGRETPATATSFDGAGTFSEGEFSFESNFCANELI